MCSLQKLEEGSGSVDFFKVDTHYSGSHNRSVVAVLYGEIGTEEFAKFHFRLKFLALDGKIDYIIRHYIKVTYFNCPFLFVC